MFISKSTSQVYVEGKVRTEDFDTRWVIDCRGGETVVEGALDNCRDDGGLVGINVPSENGDRAIQHEAWINRDAFDVVHEPLDPWRGEAVMTSEGDLQLTFHHRLPGSDFRFAVVVDPEFAPSRCDEDENGNLIQQPIDGDWIGEYTESLTEDNYDGGENNWTGQGTGGSLFLLNSVSYQFNPDQTDTTWSLPFYMEAGYATAQWGPELMGYQAPRWGMPRAYASFELDDRNGPAPADVFYTYFNPDNLPEDHEAALRGDSRFQALYQKINGAAAQSAEEFEAMYAGQIDAPDFTPYVPSEAWRRPDGNPAGFDGWGGLYYSWVRFDQERDLLTVGEKLTGEFRLYFFGANSQSHLMVEGRFETKGVRKDTWVTRDVQQDKLEESGVTLCGDGSEAE